MNNKIIQGKLAWERLIESLNPSQIIVLTDDNTNLHCLSYFKSEYLEYRKIFVVSIPHGESNKSINQAERIWNQMLKLGCDRQSLMICLGGGMITDIGGFVAATFKRGIPVIHVPTTNLAMCDAAIGGKTGFNLDGLKNQIGVFHQPKGILIDLKFLETLPVRELISGFAETFKHALISDPDLWDFMVNADLLSLGQSKDILLKSAKIKLKFVSADVKDKGIRQVLNFGHTIGHGIEAASHASAQPLLHGEAIAIGMTAEAWLSHRLKGLESEKLMEISKSMNKLLNEIEIPRIKVSKAIEQMRQDKKNTAHQITCTLLANIGIPIAGCQVSEALLAESVEFAMLQVQK